MTGTDRFPVVGIGASAGGVEALEGFVRGLPAEPGLAIVIVTHLSPERESMLHEIVARYSPLPVQIVVDAMPVRVNHIYVLSTNAELTIANRHLRIHTNSSRRAHKPIDIFFSSLAVDFGELSAGIILSGGDSDGTLGIRRSRNGAA